MELELSLKEKLLALMESDDHTLIASQAAVSFPIIERMYRKMKRQVIFGNIRVEKGVIVNGHHRYLASQLVGVPIDTVPSTLTDAKVARSWKNVEIHDQDWDTQEEIDKHNEDDAKNLGMKMGDFIEITGLI